ncbi:TIGR01777 family oxidoreductase [Pedobacter heparinus]|uniref:TIGR01777 family oxidoreductase n=1 Tax=Pedobacter heparinus TaxID=984 RepID=UPI00292DDFA6|nr:TIGR01777 family oxidoreductase [Pedobacter heparinus]
MVNKHILITGATGMIGKRLIAALLQSGHSIAVLSRKRKTIPGAKVYLWDVYHGKIEKECMDGIDTIIHLAGENIAAEKWTNKRKRQIIDSRVLSTRLLYQTIKDTNAKIGTFVSASAVGYYGDSGDEILTEESPAGYGFMADCCQQWEAAIDKGRQLGIRIVKLRTGVILAKKEGALASLEKPIRFFAGAPLGSGRQWIPWLHIDDMVAMYINAIENNLISGAYNACAPFPVTNTTLTKAIAKKLHRPVWPFKVPEKILKFMLGEMSEVIFISTNASAQKILTADFKFRYIQLDEALSDIYDS